ncbi:La domain-containing protein [Colletotrichum orchidophilum]|uniref:La domain-containing protein n=1 Tax=Colletotrichum orchidophilum TaxID=1209926 RepID=A0A1G4BIJ8_9PEZI|nr:La domain-containing protein [Colletotrichum orchidophilum]OHF01118.1 La domain-containing protein [Colletotrichum orchidophilum]
MPISASDLASDTMATAFSYAQAAKGQAATTPAAQATENGKDSASSVNGEQPGPEPNAVKSTESVDDDTSRNTPLKAQLAAKQDVSSAQAEANNTNTTSAAASVADSRRDDEEAVTEASARRSEKSVRSASASTRVTDEAEPKKGSRKPRKGKAGKESSEDSKKEKAAEQEKEEPKIELVEAPLPSVNIWTQRKETQAHKTSVTLPTANGAHNSSTPADTWPNSQESKKKNKAADGAEATNGATAANKPQRKAGDVDAAARRNGARGSRVIERESRLTEVPPPVGDVHSWPTPETAVKEIVKEEKRKPSEKVERIETEVQDDAGAKGRSKDKWERMDFVPTVQFSTPIPSVRGSRGGRGGARGGRDVTSRGGHGGAAAASADKPAGTATPSKAGNEARDRVRDGNAQARANSQPPAANKRASMEVSNGKEQRKPTAPNSGERNKESQSNATNEQAGPVRERGEGRGDRGRGGYRGRGGHPGNVSMHAQQSSYLSNGNSFGSQGPRQYASPPLHQGGSFQPSYGGSQSRGGRGGRGQSNGSGAFRGAGGPSNSGRMRQVQTNMSQVSWEYGVPMTPGSYAAFYEQTRHIMIPQMEYYFSVENLLKDTYLRKNMDSQGFVPLDLVLGFQRVRSVADPQTLRTIIAECPQLDYVLGDDGIERLRSRTHWQKFVYPNMELRFDAARNEGPQYFYPRSVHAMAHYDHGMLGDYPVISPTTYPNGAENGYVAYPTEVQGGQQNGGVNGNAAETQLSAQVPEFQPGPTSEQTAEVSSETESKTQPLVNGSASHTESAPLTNGNHAQPAEALQSYNLSSPSQRAHLVMRVRGGENSVAESHVDDVPYPEFRLLALSQRQDTFAGEISGDMISLYRFWSHFLPQHFDLEMFEEFRAYAVADATGETVNTTGLQNLIAFYEAILQEDEVYPLDNMEFLYGEAKRLAAKAEMS